jgi:hypothetical protein
MGYLLAEVAVHVIIADQSVVGVRDGDKALALCACDVWLLAKGGGVIVTTPYAYLFAVEVCVVSPGTA